MNYGFQISSSGLLTALYRQDVYANNMANMDTVGFKPDIPALMQRDAARTEDHLPFAPSDAMLERLVRSGDPQAETAARDWLKIESAMRGAWLRNRLPDWGRTGEQIAARLR